MKQKAKGFCLLFIAAAMCLVCSCSSNGQKFTKESPDDPKYKYHIYENPYWQLEVDEYYCSFDLLNELCGEFREPLEAGDTLWMLKYSLLDTGNVYMVFGHYNNFYLDQSLSSEP